MAGVAAALTGAALGVLGFTATASADSVCQGVSGSTGSATLCTQGGSTVRAQGGTSIGGQGNIENSPGNGAVATQNGQDDNALNGFVDYDGFQADKITGSPQFGPQTRVG